PCDLHSLPTRRSSDLTLGTSSDVNGGNTNASFVNGPLAKQISSSTGFTFPVGNINGVRSVRIQTTGGGGTSTFVGRSFAGNPQRSEEHTSELQSRENI